MISHVSQGARGNAGIVKEKDRGNDCGAILTSWPIAERKAEDSNNQFEMGGELVGWDDLLHWQRDNEFIPTSYRRATFSYRRSLQSVFHIHNETVNIWSHILGTIGFLGALGSLVFYTQHRNVESADHIAVLTYFISVIACFFFSVVYHTFLDHSQNTRTWTGRMDYLGIVIPLWGTTMASTHFGFHCEPTLREGYGIAATIAGLACAVTTLHPSFCGPASRRFRTLMYILLGLSSFLPIVHGIWLFGLDHMEWRMSLSYYLALAICHGTGAMAYASRVPERWFPRRYDVVGNSHQIMHLLVVCGAVAYGLGVLRAREHWAGLGCANVLSSSSHPFEKRGRRARRASGGPSTSLSQVLKALGVVKTNDI